MNMPVAGDAIRDWQNNRVIRPRAKILCALMITLSLTSLWLFANVHVLLKIVVTALLISVGTFVLTRKSA